MLPSLNSRYDWASKSCICNIAVSFLLAARSRFSVFSVGDHRRAAPQKWGRHISPRLREVNLQQIGRKPPLHVAHLEPRGFLRILTVSAKRVLVSLGHFA